MGPGSGAPRWNDKLPKAARRPRDRNRAKHRAPPGTYGDLRLRRFDDDGRARRPLVGVKLGSTRSTDADVKAFCAPEFELRNTEALEVVAHESEYETFVALSSVPEPSTDGASET